MRLANASRPPAFLSRPHHDGGGDSFFGSSGAFDPVRQVGAIQVGTPARGKTNRINTTQTAKKMTMVMMLERSISKFQPGAFFKHA